MGAEGLNFKWTHNGYKENKRRYLKLTWNVQVLGRGHNGFRMSTNNVVNSVDSMYHLLCETEGVLPSQPSVLGAAVVDLVQGGQRGKLKVGKQAVQVR